MRVHKHRRHGTNHQVRHRVRDLTPDMLNKVIERNPWNEPETKTKQQRAAWANVQEREATVQRDRFVESIGNTIFSRKGNRSTQDIKLEDQFNMLEAIRQGRVDMMDVGQASGRPGFTYSKNGNMRDPAYGLPVQFQEVINRAWDNASQMNPSVRSREWFRAQTEASNTSLSTGDPSENSLTSKLGMKTSDYMQAVPVAASDDRFTQTRVKQVAASQANYALNAAILGSDTVDRNQRNPYDQLPGTRRKRPGEEELMSDIVKRMNAGTGVVNPYPTGNPTPASDPTPAPTSWWEGWYGTGDEPKPTRNPGPTPGPTPNPTSGSTPGPTSAPAPAPVPAPEPGVPSPGWKVPSWVSTHEPYKRKSPSAIASVARGYMDWLPESVTEKMEDDLEYRYEQASKRYSHYIKRIETEIGKLKGRITRDGKPATLPTPFTPEQYWSYLEERISDRNSVGGSRPSAWNAMLKKLDDWTKFNYRDDITLNPAFERWILTQIPIYDAALKVKEDAESVEGYKKKWHAFPQDWSGF
jgi:hypothetical protein